MSTRSKGIICGIIAAISYGTNPLGALPLYKVDINADSVLFYRYSIAALILAVLMFFRKESFRIKVQDIGALLGLGVLFALSSLTLFVSFHYMDAGIASTLLFIYPIFVALIMAFFFKEALTKVTVISIFLAVFGVLLLYQGGDGQGLAKTGVMLVLMSAMSYALYIVMVNKARLEMSAIKLTFYVLIGCVLTILIHSVTPTGNSIQWLTTPYMWMCALMLAIVPTVISLVLMAIAVYSVGSTPTAIMGALEPLTAVVIGIIIFNEPFTLQLAMGIVLILSSVLYLIVGKRFSKKREI